MLKPQNIGSFDRIITIQRPTKDNSGGEQTETWSDLYSMVPAKRVKAIGRTPGDYIEENQQVAFDRAAFVIRKFDWVIDSSMRVSFDNEIWYVTSVHPYGDSRSEIVLECESRDND